MRAKFAPSKLKRQAQTTKGLLNLQELEKEDGDGNSSPLARANDPKDENTEAGQPNSEDQSEKKDSKKKDGKEKFEYAPKDGKFLRGLSTLTQTVNYRISDL